MSAVTYVDGRVVSSYIGSPLIWFDGTIPAGSQSVDVTHNLGSAPSGYTVCPINDYAVGVEVTAVTSIKATVSLTNIQGGDAIFKLGVAA